MYEYIRIIGMYTTYIHMGWQVATVYTYIYIINKREMKPRKDRMTHATVFPTIWLIYASVDTCFDRTIICTYVRIGMTTMIQYVLVV